MVNRDYLDPVLHIICLHLTITTFKTIICSNKLVFISIKEVYYHIQKSLKQVLGLIEKQAGGHLALNQRIFHQNGFP